MGATWNTGNLYRKEAVTNYSSIIAAMTQGEADEEGRVSFVLVPERTQAIMLGKTQLQGSSKSWW